MQLDVLSKATLIGGMVESTTKISMMIGQAKQYMWAISPEPLVQSMEKISGAVPQTAQYRILSPQPYTKVPNLENRTLTEPPLIMALNETHAAVCFRLIGGKVDYATSLAKTPDFMLGQKRFSFIWEKAKST